MAMRQRVAETPHPTISDDLKQRIGQIARERHLMSSRQLVEGVDALRTMAHAHGFGAVAHIAARLESALARNGAGATLSCYLDALDDAVALDLDPSMAHAQPALLASVALRLGR
jgi:hypothetical protein